MFDTFKLFIILRIQTIVKKQTQILLYATGDTTFTLKKHKKHKKTIGFNLKY